MRRFVFCRVVLTLTWTQDVPRKARNVSLQRDVYVEMQSRLVRQCTLPPTWTSQWEHETAEGEEFVSFRTNSETAELLITCYEVLGSQYFESLMVLVNAEPNEWRIFEAMVFAVRSVIRPLNAQFDVRKLPQEVCTLVVCCGGARFV